MRYIIGFLIALGLIVLLIILLIGGGNKSGHKPTGKLLYEYASTDAQVSLTVDGPVNADSLHNQIRITVDNANVTFEQIKGYQDTVVNTKLYANNTDAYDAFLHALMRIGFTQGDNDPALKDESGYCAAGDRYIVELTDGDDTLERYWSTSCDNTKTYLGNMSLTLSLFQAQVPDYDKLTANIDL
jgi:hypothetical protein